MKKVIVSMVFVFILITWNVVAIAKSNANFKQVSDLLDRCFKEKSIELCNKAIELWPEFPVSYIYRASVYNSKARFDDAILDLQKSLELYAKMGLIGNANLYFEFCISWMGKREYQQAIKSCDKAIDLHDKYPAISAVNRHALFLARGFSYAALQNYTMAIKDFTEAMKNGDPDGEIQLARAWAIAKNNGSREDYYRDLYEGCPKFIKTGESQVFFIEGNLREICLDILKGRAGDGGQEWSR